MFRQYLLMLWCWPVLVGFAAEQDSLELFLSRNNLSPQARVDYINLVARDLAYVNPVKSTELAYRALHLGKVIKYTKGQAQALRGIASGLLFNDQYFLAIKNLQQAIHLFESIDDRDDIANCYISLGHTYRKLQDREKELYYHQLAYDYYAHKGNAERTAVTTHNLGETYLYIGEWDKAIHFTERAIALNDSLNNLTVLSSCYKAMGKIWMQKNDPKKAVQYFNKVLELSARLGEGAQKMASADALLNLAKISKQKKEPLTAIRYLEEAMELIKKYNLYEFISPVYQELMTLYIKEGNLKKIEETVNVYKNTYEQLNQTKVKVISRFAELIMKTDTLEQFNLALKEKSELQEKLIAEKNTRNTITTALMGILILLAIFLTVGLVKLRRSNNYLTAQRTIIRTQNRELEELNAVKDKFLSILSHDIKAPLLGLHSYANLLTSEKMPTDSKQLALFGKELKQQLESTSAMADNLITWVKLQMKSFLTQPVVIDMAAALSDVYKVYGPAIEQKKIKLDHREESPSYVWADRNQLDFILRNLVNNAIKYSFPEGVITIDLVKQENEVVLHIADQGLGMSGETMESVSGHSHFRSRTGTAGEGGTGLGLRICREFAALNKGKIEFTSTEGVGSVFTFTLPLKQV